MSDVLYPRSWESFGNGVWQILENDTAGYIWVFLFELRTLVSYAPPNVDVQGPVGSYAHYLFVDGIHRQPRKLRCAAEGHVVIKVSQMVRLASKPGKRVQGRLPRIVEGSMRLICRVLVTASLQEGWQSLIRWAHCFVAAMVGLMTFFHFNYR